MEKTILNAETVRGWMTKTTTATGILEGDLAGLTDSYAPLEARELISSSIRADLTKSFDTLIEGFRRMAKSVENYVDSMLDLDGQATSPDGSTAAEGGNPTIGPTNGGPGKTPGGGSNINGNGGGNNGGGGHDNDGFKPPEKTPLRSPLAEYGEALAPHMVLLMDFLAEFAALNGTTVADLLTNAKFKELFEKYIKGYNIIASIIPGDLGAPEMQKWLKSIYNGEEIALIPLEGVEFIRQKLDSIASKKGITAEELLSNLDYAEELKASTSEYQKLNNFFGMLNNADNDQHIINQIYTGMVPEAYGFKSDDVYAFKDALEKLAAENKISATDLITKAEYADKLKESLDTLDPSKALGAIYKDAPSSAAQTVASNLYSAAQIGTGTANANVDATAGQAIPK